MAKMSSFHYLYQYRGNVWYSWMAWQWIFSSWVQSLVIDYFLRLPTSIASRINYVAYEYFTSTLCKKEEKRCSYCKTKHNYCIHCIHKQLNFSSSFGFFNYLNLNWFPLAAANELVCIECNTCKSNAKLIVIWCWFFKYLDV